MKRSRFVTKIIVMAMILYAGISLITLRGRIETGQQELNALKKRVAEMEISNAELEYQIEHYNDADVIAGIARSRLGLVLPGEIVFYDSRTVQSNSGG